MGVPEIVLTFGVLTEQEGGSATETVWTLGASSLPLRGIEFTRPTSSPVTITLSYPLSYYRLKGFL